MTGRFVYDPASFKGAEHAGWERVAPGYAGAWRLETVLAALYDTTGRQERARRMALVAYRHALRTGCALAENRAGTLLDRLAMGSRRRPRAT